MGLGVMGGGGHGAGRGNPGKSEFPSRWSDDRAMEAVEDVANDPASLRTVAGDGRTLVRNTIDGIDLEVYIGRDGEEILTAYPTNTGRNPASNPTRSFGWRKVEADLLALCEIAPVPSAADMEQLKTLIYVGEYSLALDNISHFYTENMADMSPTSFKMIENLAIILEIEDDRECAAVARLLTAAAQDVGST